MVAVGFNPRLTFASHDFVAERRLNRCCGIGHQLGFCRRDPNQSSLRDEMRLRSPKPWVETNGYHRVSLRDKDTPLFDKNSPAARTLPRSKNSPLPATAIGCLPFDVNHRQNVCGLCIRPWWSMPLDLVIDRSGDCHGQHVYRTALPHRLQHETPRALDHSGHRSAHLGISRRDRPRQRHEGVVHWPN